MSRELNELETVLRHLVAEHQKLLQLLEEQQQAMQKLDLRQMDHLLRHQEACRARIAGMENRRRMIVGQLARTMKLNQVPTIQQLAELYPQQGPGLLNLRSQLKEVMERIVSRNQIAGRLAGAVLGHLNTVVRLLASAVEPSGVYTKQGLPRVAAVRIGVMEAVG